MNAEQIAITLITPSSYGSKPLWRATTPDGTSWQFRADDDGGVDTLRLAALAAKESDNICSWALAGVGTPSDEPPAPVPDWITDQERDTSAWQEYAAKHPMIG